MKISNPEYWTVIGTVATVVGVPLAILALSIGYHAYRRQFGYQNAQVRLLRAEPSDAERVKLLRKKSMFNTELVGLNDLNEMIRWNPTIIFESLDNNPLEAVRIEVSPTSDPFDHVIDVRDNWTDADAKMTPWGIERVMSREYPITSQPGAGRPMSVPISDLLVRHMAQSQVKEPERRHRAHYTKYMVTLYAKLAGSPTWSEEIDRKAIMFIFFWYPKGFPEDQCEEFAKKFYQPPTLLP